MRIWCALVCLAASSLAAANHVEDYGKVLRFEVYEQVEQYQAQGGETYVAIDIPHAPRYATEDDCWAAVQALKSSGTLWIDGHYLLGATTTVSCRAVVAEPGEQTATVPSRGRAPLPPTMCQDGFVVMRPPCPEDRLTISR